MLQDKVHEAAARFSLPALLDLLHHLGYQGDDVEFKSSPALAHQAALIQSVDLPPGPGALVEVMVNLGLLGAQGPLPSYFKELLSRQHEGSLEEFLGFFDHQLIKNRALTLYPERDPSLVQDLEGTKRRLLALLGIKSPSTLHWLFTLIFPELGVSVRRSVQRQQLKTDGVLLGSAVLGRGCAFGGIARVPVGGINVMLSAE